MSQTSAKKKRVCVAVSVELLALVLPSEPSVALEAGIPVNTSQIRVFFPSCFVLLLLLAKMWAGRLQGLTATRPVPPLFSRLLSSLPFSRFSRWAPSFSVLLSCLTVGLVKQCCLCGESEGWREGYGGGAFVKPEMG